MFSIAIIIGLYSYLLFSLGLMGLLYKNVIVFSTLVFFGVIFVMFKTKILKINIKILKNQKFILSIIIIQSVVNLIGALGPELGFDALWYHLTLPKIFLEGHKLIHIGGGLLYYSDMPKLTEMLYFLPLSTIGEIGAKLIHFGFGILTLIAIYKVSRKFLDEKFSLISSLIFYTNLVVGWQSTTAYIDLARTFFEIMALWGFINWYEIKKESSAKMGWLIESSVMVGLSVSTKLLGLESLFIFSFLIVYLLKRIDRRAIKYLLIYCSVALYVSLPWFIFSFLNTGNPVYPFFGNYMKGVFIINFNPLAILKVFWDLSTHSSDPISPIYIVFLPFILVLFRKFTVQMKIIILYGFFSLILWYFNPAKESRYFLPGLAAFSIVCSYMISILSKDSFFRKLSFTLIIFISLISILYRGVANSRYFSVILGNETNSKFLTDNLNFKYGDFYDTDGYFKTHLKNTDKVLLYGFHNLYYVDFPFIDSSYVKKGNKFNYIAIQNYDVPERFKFWKLIYKNAKTGVRLYSVGGQEWVY